MIVEILQAILILLVVASLINYSDICVRYYNIKSDIDDISDKDLKVYLLMSLVPLPNIFCKRFIFNLEKDYFNSLEDYNAYLRYKSILIYPRLGNFYQPTKIIKKEEIPISQEGKPEGIAIED